jgi:hypothetical protein
MNNPNITIVFGASDPEQVAADNLARAAGLTVAYATIGGKRVHPGNAYNADSVDPSIVADASAVFLFECRPANAPDQAVVLDHHHDGDTGYGRPPAEFLSASSVGQLAIALASRRLLPVHRPGDPGWLPRYHPHHWWGGTYGNAGNTAFFRLDDGRWRLYMPTRDGSGEWLDVPRPIVLAAAADHCLAAAYRGQCPGVDPDALMQWRAETRAAHQERTVDEVLADVEAARKILNKRSVIWVEASSGLASTWDKPIAGAGDYDWVPYPIIPHFKDRVPELPEAAAREGLPFTAEVTAPDGRRKVILQGADENTIREWMDARSAEGAEVYGDPVRGFAGCYPVSA